MEIKLNLNLNEIADSSEKDLYYSTKKNNNVKNIMVFHMITRSLNNTFKKINKNLVDDAKKQVEYLISQINSNSTLEYAILALDLTAWKNKTAQNKDRVSTIGDVYNKKERLVNPINNVCIVIKLPSAIIDNLNTVCFFCDFNIEINQDIQKTFLWIKRIELLEYYGKLNSISNLKISIADRDGDWDPEFLKSFLQIKPVIPFGQFKEIKKYLRFEDWFTFINATLDYCDRKKESDDVDANQIIFTLEENEYKQDDDVRCFLLQSKKSFVNLDKQNSNYYLISTSEDNTYQITINQAKSVPLIDIIKQIQQLITDNKTSIQQLEDENKNKTEFATKLDKKIKDLGAKINEYRIKYEASTNELTVAQKKLTENEEKLQEELNQLKQTKSDDEKFQVNLKVSQAKIEKLNKQLEEDQTTFRKLQEENTSLHEEIEKINASKNTQTKSFNQTQDYIQENHRKIENLKEDNSRYQTKINDLTTKDYNCSEITFSFVNDKNPDFKPLIFHNCLNNETNDFFINEQEIGKISKLKRYKYGLDKIQKGYYKNPFLITKLTRPQDLVINGNNQISSELANYNLENNPEQKLAVQKGINIDCLFYLQGPPGTGKTQTICAIGNQYAIEHKTILMTSQSHEAINNFFDRLNELNNNHPELICIKYIANQQQDLKNDYNISNAWSHFLTKCLNKCDPPNSTNSHLMMVKELKNKLGEIPSFLSEAELNLVKEHHELIDSITNSERFPNDWKERIEFEDKHANNNLEGFLKYISDNEKNNFLKKNKEEINQLLDNYDELIGKLIQENKLQKIFNNFDEIISFINKNSTEIKYASLFREKYLQDSINLTSQNEFAQYIVNNHLINFFGITTSSKITLSLLKPNDTDLFYDWPIDIVIIDEISKSTTPEIISRIVLAKKVIFAGDYKQLPPQSDFSKSECDELMNDKAFQEKITALDPTAKNFYKWLEKLHQESFFKKEVIELKDRPSLEKVPYQYLIRQHRSNQPIMNLVNVFYDQNEKLIMADPNRKPITYQLHIPLLSNGIKFDLSGPLILIDSGIIDEDTKTFLQNQYQIKLTKNNNAFDTEHWPNVKSSGTGKMNPYNAMIVVNLVLNLLKENPNLKQESIGVIAMTLNQKRMINYFLKRQNIKNCKVDTVDNFQGRESEIIILDFVRALNFYENNELEKRKSRNLKFYFVNERNNVAFSRPREKLIIIGDFANHYLNPESINDFHNNEEIREHYDFLKKAYEEINQGGLIIKSEELTWQKTLQSN